MAVQLPLIAEPEAVLAVLDAPELLIVDVCQPQVWQQLHVKGAVHVDPSALLSGLPPVPNKLPDKAALESLFSRIGYSPDKHIVVYDDEGGGWAGRFIWTLDVIGHQHTSYLNGGLHAWYRENNPVESDARAVVPTEVKLAIDTHVIAELDTVLATLNQPGIHIWDARSAEEYAGLKSGSRRAGHIPGAVNIDWLELMDRSRNLRLLPTEQLQAKLLAAGFKQGDEIITHCQSHHRSGLTYLVARALGYRVKAYHGSWAEWGNRPDTPVATGSEQSV